MRSVLVFLVLLFATVFSQEDDGAAPCNCDAAVAEAASLSNQAKATLEHQVSELSNKITATVEELTRCHSDSASKSAILVTEQEELQTKIASLQAEKATLEATANKVPTLEGELATLNKELEGKKAELESAKVSAAMSAKENKVMLEKAQTMVKEAVETLASTKAELAELQVKSSGYFNFGKVKDDIISFINKLTGKSPEL